MSAEFYPRTRPDQLWVDGGTRYMFQKGVMSLAGPDVVEGEFLEAEQSVSDAFYGHQARMMQRANPGLVQGGNDMFWSHTADFVAPSLNSYVLEDPVGLDFRMPSEHTEYLERQDLVAAHPTSAPWMQHSDTPIRMAVTPTTQQTLQAKRPLNISLRDGPTSNNAAPEPPKQTHDMLQGAVSQEPVGNAASEGPPSTRLRSKGGKGSGSQVVQTNTMTEAQRTGQREFYNLRRHRGRARRDHFRVGKGNFAVGGGDMGLGTRR